MKKLLLTTILIILSVLCFGQDPQSIAMSNYFFVSSGNWNDGSHWNTGEVPPEGSDVFIAADAVIPAGYTAIANQISLLGGSITVADGGQLKHNTQGLVVTMEKSIAAFNEVNSWSNYYLLAFPFSEDVAVPSTMTANEDNDFYTFDSNYPNAEWRNNKQHVIATVGGTTGYLYANPEAIELSLTGSTYQSYDEASITVEVTYSEGLNNTFNGWALLGNPYTCNAYIYALENGSCVPKEFMVYDADGELVRCFCSSVAPMQGFFVKVDETTTICIKTTSPYVDLGLPSGTLWAACNVGAVTPEDYGDYFAWGETQPKDFYDWSTYQHCNGSNNTLTKYCSDASFGYNGFSDTLTVLLPEDDAATANWGNDWRMPTKEEWQELYNNTIHVWTTQNGVNGRLFTSENGNSLFLPAGGIYSNGSLGSTGSGSYYWSSSLSFESPNLSWQCSSYSNGCNSYEFARFFGLSVRPVSSGIQSTSYLIDATANPTEGGEVSGSGSFIEGTECTLTATANEGYTFTNWTENDEVVSTEAVYIVTVDSDRTLVANFTYNSGSNHEYVDLGLPSATLWATCNIGANSPEEYGDYFAWGETQPKEIYDWSTYQYSNGGDWDNPNLTKYCTNSSYGYNGFTDNLTTLLPEDDAATVNWGADWRMPSPEECEELYENTSHTWTTLNGVNGRLFTGPNGNSLFLPAAGSCFYTTYNSVGIDGYCWTNSLYADDPMGAWYFYFFSGNCSVNGGGYRENGIPVRAVRVTPQNTVPTGAIDGLFSINESQQVYFSQGNLQYQASTNTWKFAENQYDYVGSDNSNISSFYSGWIDLFGWGTSGYNHGAVCYQPWSTSTSYSDYYAYGSYTYNLYDQTGQADWGYNPINNGGNQANQWRTLTKDEWTYVFNSRTTSSGIRYAKAKVNDVNGVILLPDDWSSDIYSLSDTNSGGASYSSNVITASQWSTLERAGAVFLPAADGRNGASVNGVGFRGSYWSSSRQDSYYAVEGLAFIDNAYYSWLSTGGGSYRYEGKSVRLVSISENNITNYTITVTSNPAEGGNVGGGGIYQQGQSCTVIATANTDYMFMNWTENNEVVSVNASYTFTVSSDRTLFANYTYIGGGSDHDYVDLGLPSGLLWATCNVGAIFPEDYGYYFAWGETQPKDDFTYMWSTYQHCNGSYNTLIKYCNNSDYGYNGFMDNLTVLQPEDDAAMANWGVEWRVPTEAEWEELFNNTTCTWTTQNGINGILFTASNGNSLFLPAAGGRFGSVLDPGGSQGEYWTSSLNTWSTPNKAYGFSFDSYGNYSTWEGENRSCGISIRAVRSTQPITPEYSITITSSPIGGGIVTGGGTYQQGQSCTVSATATSGYTFTNWTENGSVVSTNANYTFTVNSNRTLVANFSVQASNTYTISVSSNPTNGGSVTGGGTYQQGQSCTVSATANSGYTFMQWTENGNQVSTNASYTFMVTGNRTLVAQFQLSATAPTVTTTQITNIQQTTAIGGGNVTNSGGSTVSERGICWSTSHNPTTSGTHASSGTGTGAFMVNMTGLTANTTYYVRAYATNSIGTAYGSEVSFTTLQNTTVPTVTTIQVQLTGQTTATAIGNVTSSGNATVTERGICWGTNHNPTIGSSSHVSSGMGTGSFTVTMTGLTPGTTYYVRAYAINNVGTSYGNELVLNIDFPTVTTSQVSNITHVSAVGGGNVTSSGSAPVTDRGICWSTSHNPTTSGSHASSGSGKGSFTVSMTGLTANTTYYVRAYATSVIGTAYGSEVSFTTSPIPSYTISVTANPSNGGTISGGGIYTDGQTCTLTASANTGYIFVNWTENGTLVSGNVSYSFTVSGDRSLEANFFAPGVDIPIGAINGLFTINANGDQVYFSQGNLQYKASTGTWRFAPNQYDCVGIDNSGISQTYNRWIDLFGWGTSGYPTGVGRIYQPWSSDGSGSTSNLYGPPGENNLSGSYANSDWGIYNAISNGGNTTNTWRTLTGGSDGEWKYILETRNTSSGIRYAKATVNGVLGIILLPDNWNESYYPLYNTNMSNASFSSNNISISQWPTLEQLGAVFLPAAGYRTNTSFHEGYSNSPAGYYWSSTCSGTIGAKSLEIDYFSIDYSAYSYPYRYRGYSVRLVQDY